MSSSLAPQQLKFENHSEELKRDAEPGATQAGTVPLRPPTFDRYIRAVTARNAGRINASAVSDKEHQGLLGERAVLLDKVLAGTASRQEQNRLEYVRWSLDRIEDARHGEALDQLEAAIVSYEDFSADLAELQRQLGTGRRKKRK